MPWDDGEVRDMVARIETALSAFSARNSPVPASQVMDAVEGIVALYGEALARMLAHVESSGAGRVTDAFAGDELVSHLLLVHDLHPLACSSRVQKALEEVRERFGAAAELVLDGISENTATIHLGSGVCRSTVDNVRSAVEEALARLAPEIEQVEIRQPASTTVIPPDSLFAGGRVPEAG